MMGSYTIFVEEKLINIFNFMVHKIVPSLQRWNNSCVISVKQYIIIFFYQICHVYFIFPNVAFFLSSTSVINKPIYRNILYYSFV